MTLDVDPIDLLADRGQMAQVLTNLITNSYDAMGESGSLRITASIEGRAVVIQVEDDGPGIERSLAERVFEPFYTAKHQGTGLGLAIVRRMVEAHGGSVHVAGDASRGTRFVVRLPYRGLPPTTAPARPAFGVARSQDGDAERTPKAGQIPGTSPGAPAETRPTARQ